MSWKNPTRRGFGKAVGTAALGAYGAPSLVGESGAPTPGLRRFPDNFLWACATASYQVEGAAFEDGRKASIWDAYSRTPGKIANGDTGDVADDHYHRYPEDIALMKSLGVKGYRYSVAWPRVFPDGTGAVNDKGIAFYDRLTDALLAAGIQPWVTLYHWDLPQALQDRWGGWESAETAKAFADYAGFVAGKLSDRVHHFFTINEFTCIADQGYGTDEKAPGKRLPPARLNQVRHHAVLGHGLALQAVRAAARPGTKVGIAENPSIAVPVIETPMNIEAARRAMRVINGPFLTAVLEGAYPNEYLSAAGKNAPKFTAAEMKAIGGPLDFVGLNIYAPTHVRADGSPLGFAEVPHPRSYPSMYSDWLFLDPAIAYWAPRHAAEIWNVKEIYFTENGCSSADIPNAAGHIDDTDRVMYLRTHLAEAHRAIAEGWPLRGYFLWSLLDNFEWKYGYQKRFGLYYVDFKSQKRTPKLSAKYYQELIRRNAMV